MQARAKNDMKPSPMPWVSRKRSLCCARSAITPLMSISLKVVRMAAVRCACTSRSAIRLRSRLIGTRSSPSTWGSAGAATEGRRLGAGAEGTAASVRAGCTVAERPRARWLSTSSLVSRPPLPEAGMMVGSRSCSVTSRRTAGLSGPGPPERGGAGAVARSAARAAGGSATGGGALTAGAGGGGGAAAAAAGLAAARPAASSRRATTSPTATVSPCCFRMCSTPAAPAGSSVLALSVSSSSRTSSGPTTSPSCFAQRTMTPSVTDSPRLGIRTSKGIRPLFLPGPCSAREGVQHEIALFGLVDLVGARRRTRGFRAPDIRQRAIAGQDALEAPIHDVPSPHVPRLFLHPENLAPVRVGGEDRLELLLGKRVELLDAHDGGGVERALAAGREQVIVDFAAAEEKAGDGLRVDDDARLGSAADRHVADHGLEGPVGEIREGRHGGLVPQEALRAHDDEGLPEVPVHLPPERVEVLRRRAQVADLHVLLGGQLEEALEPRARVLRALSLVAVGQQENEPAHALPLRLRARDELIDHDLGAVHEVTELGLPDRELMGIGEAHAELEAEDGVLREHAVQDHEARLSLPDVIERDVPGV